MTKKQSYNIAVAPPLRSTAQLQAMYVNQKFGCIFHFNMGTFNDKDWADPDLAVDTFAPTGLDIDQWLDLVVASGGKYAILTAKHVDGFALWPTAYKVTGENPYSIAQTTWYANNGSPDIVSLFVTKCRAKGLRPGLYFSAWDTTYETRSGTNLATDTAGYLAMIQTQLTELLRNYGQIAIIWIDAMTLMGGYNPALITGAMLRTMCKAIDHSCTVVLNLNAEPPTSDIWETEVVPIASGNTKYAEQCISIISAGNWFFSPTSPLRTLLSANFINTGINWANANNCSYLLNLTPNQAGAVPAYQVTRMASVGPGKRATTFGWWSPTGTAAAKCVAAYQAKGMASLAASKVNLFTPGVHNLTADADPDFAAATGWTFNGTTQNLKTDIVPVSGYSMLVRYSSSTVNKTLVGEWVSGARFDIERSGTTVVYGSGDYLGVAPTLTSGVLGIAGQQGYRNGVADGGAINAWGAGTAAAIYIGDRGGASQKNACVIQAVAIYEGTLSAADMAAVAAAMAAL